MHIGRKRYKVSMGSLSCAVLHQNLQCPITVNYFVSALYLYVHKTTWLDLA